ncbi:hypothetical protein [Nostoc sp.]
MRSPFTATQPSIRYRIYKLSLVSMSWRSQFVERRSPILVFFTEYYAIA